MGATTVNPHSDRSGSNVRERILDAAMAILRVSGLQEFTQMRIAETAGVRQSHLTYYFPKRDDLLNAVTERVVGGIVSGVMGAVDPRGKRESGTMLERLARSVADQGHMRMFLATIIEADADPALRTVMVDAARRIEAALAQALGGDDGRERSRCLLAAVWGLGLYEFLVRPSRRTDPTRRYLEWIGATLKTRT